MKIHKGLLFIGALLIALTLTACINVSKDEAKKSDEGKKEGGNHEALLVCRKIYGKM